ncbi:unnamed protein product [Prorocentrum cordatum]|uniref:Uncharacterized protein n=1 Tax=Prorocentrum cordatum TaxID=2364126 RepID=A0ABN9R464_9DINO|nr:unnamed protein product [Polarella glacialis]
MPRHRSAVGRPPGQNGQTPGLDKQQYLTHSAPPEGLTRQDSGTRLARYTPGGIAPTRSNNKKDRAGVLGAASSRGPQVSRAGEEARQRLALPCRGTWLPESAPPRRSTTRQPQAATCRPQEARRCQKVAASCGIRRLRWRV